MSELRNKGILTGPIYYNRPFQWFPCYTFEKSLYSSTVYGTPRCKVFRKNRTDTFNTPSKRMGGTLGIRDSVEGLDVEPITSLLVSMTTM